MFFVEWMLSKVGYCFEKFKLSDTILDTKKQHKMYNWLAFCLCAMEKTAHWWVLFFIDATISVGFKTFFWKFWGIYCLFCILSWNVCKSYIFWREENTLYLLYVSVYCLTPAEYCRFYQPKLNNLPPWSLKQVIHYRHSIYWTYRRYWS